MISVYGGRQLLRRLVEIGDGAVGVQFHCRIGTQLDKRGEFLQFGIGPLRSTARPMAVAAAWRNCTSSELNFRRFVL